MVLIATYVINIISTAHNSGLSPFEKLYETLPDHSSLRVFGCTCFVLKLHVERTRLSLKSTLCVFLGYGVSQKGYRCYDPVGQKLFTSRHVDFLKHIPYYSVPASLYNLIQYELRKINHFDDITNELLPVLPLVIKNLFQKQPQKPLKPHQKPHQKPYLTPHQTPHHKPPPLLKLLLILLQVVDHSVITWDLIPLPIGKRAIGSRAVYKIKNLMGPLKDDIIGIESSKLELAHHFPMKDLGLLRCFLGIEVVFFTKRIYFVSIQVYSHFVCAPTTVQWDAFLHNLRFEGLGGASMILSRKEEVVPKVDDVSLVNRVFDGAFGGDGEEDFVMGEGAVVSSSLLDRSTKSCLDGMIVSLIFLEGLEEEAWVKAMNVE
nr:Gag-Pol polyprotein [Tanacetum cinerariifolium]